MAETTIETPPKKSGFAIAEHLVAAAKQSQPGAKPPEKNEPVVEKKTEPAADSKPVAEPAKTATTPVPQTDPDEEILSGKRNPKSEDFKRVKATASEKTKAAEDALKTVEQLRKEVEELKKKPSADPAELEQARKDLAAAKEIQNIVALEYAPEFQAKYNARRESVVSDLKGVVEATKVDALVQLMELPDSPRKLEQLNELIEELPHVQQNEVIQANRAFRSIRAERESELKNANAKLTALHSDRQARGKEILTKMEQAFEAQKSKMLSENPLFKKKDGDNEWNEEVEKSIEAAKTYYFDRFDTVEQKASVVLQAARVPTLLRQNLALSQALQEREEKIAKLTSANPTVEGGGTATQPSASTGGFANRVLKATGR